MAKVKIKKKSKGYLGFKRKPAPKRPWCGKDMPTLPALVEHHSDDRGLLDVIFSDARFKSKAGSVAIVTSKAGTQRANHLHHKDSHLCYVVNGEIEYFERAPNDPDALINRIVVKAGQSFFTPPKVEHTMFFPVDTVFVTIGDRSRTQKDYESDLQRVPSLKDAHDAYHAAHAASRSSTLSGHGVG